jgi:hypothetical protein
MEGFKSKYISILSKVENDLLKKYPGEADRVKNTVRTLIFKLILLDRGSVEGYVQTVKLAAEIYPELTSAIPKQEEVNRVRHG